MKKLTDLEEDRLQQVQRRLDIYGLSNLYSRWRDENTGDENPYHNNQHQAIMALHAHRLSTIHLKPESVLVKTLFLAALYHDYNHTGDPTLPDSRNIERARDAWHNHALRLGLGIYQDDAVDDFIGVTEHDYDPSTIYDKEVCKAATILRECDYAYDLEPDREEWLRRLSEELRRPITDSSTRAFLKKLPFKYLEINY